MNTRVGPLFPVPDHQRPGYEGVEEGPERWSSNRWMLTRGGVSLATG